MSWHTNLFAFVILGEVPARFEHRRVHKLRTYPTIPIWGAHRARPCPSVPVRAHLRWFCLPDARSTKTIMMWIWSNLFLRSIPKYHSPDSKLFNLLSWIWARHKFCFKCFKPPWRSPRVLVTCMVPEIFPGRSPVNGRSCVEVGKPDLESPNCSEHLPDLLKRS